MTRSVAQKPACKELEHNGQRPGHYTPASNLATSRSLLFRRLNNGT
ncbi:acetyltransferase [Lacticaseibacillus zeae]|uniref:Acetyltransferase n=1 Tax=Lacticaseibacillus zeae TaxID=57037 RepID=A0A5R8LKC0_LACZE|nr:acetyltransferase [Lacticaseibacillus zeae]